MVEWQISDHPVPYQHALNQMEARVDGILDGTLSELIWLLEHPPLYTGGTSAKSKDLINPRFPVHQSRRGGQYTYHGPGQRVVYVMLDLNRRGKDVRRFVAQLEDWIIATLADFQISAARRDGRVGVWVDRPEKPRGPNGSMAEDKIAAIGVRIRKWVSFHGISINVDPDLSHYDGIVPCGIAEHGVTSMVDLGLPVTLTDLDLALGQHFDATVGMPFGCVTES